MKKTLFFLVLASGILTGGSLQAQQPKKTFTPQEIKKMSETKAVIETKFGSITLKFFPDVAPGHVKNFIDLAKKGFYEGTTFHRVIPGFMIQGGDPDGDGTGGPGYTIKDEFRPGNKNDRGTISMANAGPNTGGSQFFLNVVSNNFLDKKHPTFGKVVAGMEVVDAIANTPRNRNDKPLTAVIIRKASIVEK